MHFHPSLPLTLFLSLSNLCVTFLCPHCLAFVWQQLLGWVFFWSAVRAPGTTGADGVLPCMNGEMEERSWIESLWMVSVQHLPLVAPHRHHRNMAWSATAFSFILTDWTWTTTTLLTQHVYDNSSTPSGLNKTNTQVVMHTYFAHTWNLKACAKHYL